MAKKQSSNQTKWFHRSAEDDWIFFLPQAGIKLQCANFPEAEQPFCEFQVFHPNQAYFENPTLIYDNSGDCSIWIYWAKNPTPKPALEVYRIYSGEVTARDPVYGRRCADIISTQGTYIRTAENLPSSLKDPLIVALDRIENSLVSKL